MSEDRMMNMNTYIFLTDEGYTFQPEPGAEPIEIENLQLIGTAKGLDANTAYRNLLAENPQIEETSFQRIFCYQLDKENEGNRKDYNLSTE
jgi:hypothetical protein